MEGRSPPPLAVPGSPLSRGVTHAFYNRSRGGCGERSRLSGVNCSPAEPTRPRPGHGWCRRVGNSTALPRGAGDARRVTMAAPRTRSPPEPQPPDPPALSPQGAPGAVGGWGASRDLSQRQGSGPEASPSARRRNGQGDAGARLPDGKTQSQGHCPRRAAAEPGRGLCAFPAVPTLARGFPSLSLQPLSCAAPQVAGAAAGRRRYPAALVTMWSLLALV